MPPGGDRKAGTACREPGAAGTPRMLPCGAFSPFPGPAILGFVRGEVMLAREGRGGGAGRAWGAPSAPSPGTNEFAGVRRTHTQRRQRGSGNARISNEMAREGAIKAHGSLPGPRQVFRRVWASERGEEDPPLEPGQEGSLGAMPKWQMRNHPPQPSPGEALQTIRRRTSTRRAWKLASRDHGGGGADAAAGGGGQRIRP